MRTLTVTTFITLDGVVQGPGGPDEDLDRGFAHGGWAVPHIDDRIIATMADVVAGAGALLLGRRTYDVFAATWPLADDPIGSRINAMPKYVASRTLGTVSWTGAELLTGDVPGAVRALKQTGGGEIQVHGSGDLVRTLAEHDLVDEYHLMVFPVVLGSGKRLFGGPATAGFRLIDTTTFGDVVRLRYARAGQVEYGAMGPETGNW